MPPWYSRNSSLPPRRGLKWKPVYVWPGLLKGHRTNTIATVPLSVISGASDIMMENLCFLDVSSILLMCENKDADKGCAAYPSTLVTAMQIVPFLD